jgi:BirA family transcriptional regulator, biotin operon repressor / biotin---[acetyl-CoA-carboxylase] ligase
LQTRWLGQPLYTFDRVASTNSTLWDLLDRKAPVGTTVIAAQQSAGRGQWGRQWQSPCGGLYLSLAMVTATQLQNGQPVLAAETGLLTLSSAWGLATCLRAQGVPVDLKWPNDLMVRGRKLGGILTETRLHQGQVTAAIVGIGLNWKNPVPDTGINLQTLLGEAGSPNLSSLEALAALTLGGVELGYDHWQTVGAEALISDYLPLLQTLGEAVVVQGQAGTVVGVTTDGQLRVQLHPAAADTTATEVLCLPGSICLRTSL